jgi:hypothetical protein
MADDFWSTIKEMGDGAKKKLDRLATMAMGDEEKGVLITQLSSVL